MKCRICGRNFDGDGDICEECQEQDIEEVETEVKDEEITVKRRYCLRYELLSYYFIYILFLLTGIITESAVKMVLCILAILVIVGVLLYRNKRKAKATKCKFYIDRVEFSCKFGFNAMERKIDYEDLDAVNFEQKILQRFFNMGDVFVYAKKGNLLTTGIEIRNVGNFKETKEKINELIGEE